MGLDAVHSPRIAPSPLKGRGSLLLALVLLPLTPATAAPDPVLAAQLRARTQALDDAVEKGDKSVWDAALDPAVTVVDENEKLIPRAELLAGMAPLPDGLSGQIRIADYKLNREGNVAVANYINDEMLDYQGQLLRIKYRVTDTWILRGTEWKLLAEQVGAIPDDPPAATLPAATLAQYAGQYELTFDIHFRIDVVNGKLIGQRQGGKFLELKPEAPDVFFVSGSPRLRRVFQRDASGAITAFVDRREGHDIVWKKVQ